ncbi:hypothetical protein BOTBODRAFT_185322 [Botryobasidium botryosum FD-172 SS1]|uniref:Telomeric single stranded DNA binding POT1/Cdc13 domain-containing protein n=1 Tax=Botryobasidium botryosum (strain FD-172 SS1) TaxID=930990 RepID=A0A067N1A2_BOTB1|nr:hypothetical protein BOTBODRAFT_185322 [Botryobasidium botryosum FD-172 SS1]
MSKRSGSHHPLPRDGAAKRPRIDNNALDDPFDPGQELAPSELEVGVSYPSGYVSGVIKIKWPRQGSSKILFHVLNDEEPRKTFVVELKGPLVAKYVDFDRMEVALEDPVLISLKSGEIVKGNVGKDKAWPFKIVFPTEFVIKFPATHRRAELTVDLFNVKEKMGETWFSTPPEPTPNLDVEMSLRPPQEDEPEGLSDVPAEEESMEARTPRSELRPQTPMDVDPVPEPEPAPPAPPQTLDPADKSTKKKKKKKKKRDTRHENDTTRDAPLAAAPAPAEVQAAVEPAPPAQNQAEEAAKDIVVHFGQPNVAASIALRSSSCTYTSLDGLKPQTRPNVIGVVCKVGEKVTSSGEHLTSLAIKDPSNEHGVAFSLFAWRDKKEYLPPAVNGHVLLLQNMHMRAYGGGCNGTGYKSQFRWVLYDPSAKKCYHFKDGTLDQNGGPYYNPNLEEVEYMAKLGDWHNNPSGVVNQIQAKYRRQQQTIAGAQIDIFFDCVVEVLRIFPTERCTEVDITDYTSREDLNGSNEEPRGCVVRVELWETSHEEASKLKMGGIYLFANLRLQLRDVVRGKHNEGHQIQPLRMNPPENDAVIALLRRKAEYQDAIENPPPVVRAESLMTPFIRPESKESPVICKYPYHPRSTITQILQSKECPAKFTFQARIIDYLPVDLNEAVERICKRCTKLLGKDCALCFHCAVENDDLGSEDVLYRYRMAFALEGKSGQGELADLLQARIHDEYMLEFIPSLPRSQAEAKDPADAVKALHRHLKDSGILGNLELVHRDLQAGGRQAEEASPIYGPYLDLCVMKWSAVQPRLDENGKVVKERFELFSLFGAELRPQGAASS